MRKPPHRFDKTCDAGDVERAHGALAPGGESGVTVAVAGRLMRSRPQGKLFFGELRDWTGSVQLFGLEATTPDFDELCRCSLGDWLGATGEVVRTKRGELSVKVASWELLAEARRGFGDKWRGLRDPDIRYRQREVDLWANDGVRETFLLRSKVVASLRSRLGERGFVEVETPVLHPVPGGATARPFVTRYNALHTDFFLRIATEIYLKRCVVGGLERVYEIGRIFRNEGLSPRHNPEFTMLELYEAYADYTDIMVLVEELVSGVCEEVLGTTTLTYQGRELDLKAPWRRATMVELIAEHAGEEVSLEMGVAELRRVAKRHDVAYEERYGPGKLLLEIYEKTTEVELWGPVFVCDYPEEVSPLARSHPTKPGYVERFEAIVAGRELCNAFSELGDPDEQRARFTTQEAERVAGDDEAMPVDWEYLRALEHGLPPTGGLGIGIDRLVMLYADKANIKEVLLFPALRPQARPGPAELEEDA